MLFLTFKKIFRHLIFNEVSHFTSMKQSNFALELYIQENTRNVFSKKDVFFLVDYFELQFGLELFGSIG